MNHLAGETSPYLRQHADNPVEWFGWGDAAFARARETDRPLFVSIGYASCHWCHVMARESFSDPAIGALLDRAFVSVKVDREERPDVDALYMAAVQATTGSGGWPMSVWCTPDGRPFFAGTYFPPTDRHGMPSFRRVLDAVADAWATRRAEVEAQADALAAAVAAQVTLPDRLGAAAAGEGAAAAGEGAAAAGEGGGPAFASVLAALVAELGGRFDDRWGGWGPAPKFPRPTFVELCLRHAGATGDARAGAMATRTLDAMAAGGIYDHLAGGFARYSTDPRWLVPHFEKMLTDQALLARAYLHGWQATGEPAYRQVLAETLDYVLEDLTAPGGGFCSSRDADAAGVEGGHATWTPAEVAAALTDAGLGGLGDAACEWYGITEAGNWEGRSIPVRPLGAPLARPPQIESARRALLAARARRPQPARDDKVLTEWTAMTVAVLAEAAAACGVEGWAGAAVRAAEALFARNRRADGRWLRAAGSGVPAFAADYAWVLECCTRLGELTGEASWTARAGACADELLDLFVDPADGGLCTVGHDGEPLIARAKDVLDGAVPSAASSAAAALLRLGALTGEDRWRAAGERLVALGAPLLETQPLAVADLLPALALAQDPSELVVVGDRADLRTPARRLWLPGTVTAWGEPSPSPLWEGRPPGAAYLCRRFQCRAPLADAAALEAELLPLAVVVGR